MTAHVWIAQCLCPQRHCIMAGADEAESGEGILATVREQVATMLDSAAINPWCGLCKAPADTWSYEAERSLYRTMDEAMPAIRQNEVEQAIVRALFGDRPGSGGVH